MNENRMTEGSIRKLMLSFALPVFVSQLFQQLYNTADSVIVGKFLGTDALAAVGSSGNLIFLLISFFEGVATGAGILIANRYGARDLKGVRRAVHTDIAFGFAAGGFMTVVGFFFIGYFLKWINTDADVFPLAMEYYKVYFLGSIGNVVYTICRGIMMAVGDSKRPLLYLIFSSVLNVLLDVLFVGVFRWGVWSAALATVIAQFISAILCIIALIRHGGSATLYLREIRFYKNELRLVIKYGVPSGVQNSVIGFANVIVLSQINTFGKIATAAYGSYSKIEGFAFLPITSFTMSISTFIGQNLGAKEYDRAKKGARFGVLSAVIIAELIGVAMYISARPLFSLFTDDAEVIALGMKELRTIAPFYALLAYSHSVASVCRGAGKAVVPMVIMLSVWCVIRVSWILITMHLFNDIVFVYWAYPLTWSISSVIYCIYYYASDWVHGFER